jgi:hypothetical protein
MRSLLLRHTLSNTVTSSLHSSFVFQLLDRSGHTSRLCQHRMEVSSPPPFFRQARHTHTCSLLLTGTTWSLPSLRLRTPFSCGYSFPRPRAELWRRYVFSSSPYSLPVTDTGLSTFRWTTSSARPTGSFPLPPTSSPPTPRSESESSERAGSDMKALPVPFLRAGAGRGCFSEGGQS